MLKFKKQHKHFFITKYKSMFCIEDIIKIARYDDNCRGGKIYKARLNGINEDYEFNIDPDDQERLVKYIKQLGYDKI